MLDQGTGLAAAVGLSVALHAALYWNSGPSRTEAVAFAPPQGKAGAKVTVRVIQQKKSTKVEAEPTPPAPAPPAPEFEKPTPKAVRRVEGPATPDAKLEPPAVVARRNAQSTWVAAVGDVRVEAAVSAPPPRPKPLTPPDDIPKPPDRIRPREEALLADAEVVAQLDDVAAQQALKATGAETIHPPRATYSILPNYPPEALAERREGKVMVRFLLDAGGVVRDVRVAQSSGRRDFDEEAVRTMALFRFSPSRRGQVAVASEHTYTFTFTMPRM